MLSLFFYLIQLKAKEKGWGIYHFAFFGFCSEISIFLTLTYLCRVEIKWSLWKRTDCTKDRIVLLYVDLGIDWIYYSNWFLALFIPLKIWKYDFTIVWTSSKDKNFPKIWRMWLKNWVSYAHFNFELLKGMAALIFGPHPWNLNQVCIFYR